MKRFLVLALLALPLPALADTVVFNPGLGDGANSFAAIARAVRGADTFNTARPDRIPGDEDGKRSPLEVAQNLHARLQSAGKKPPYILVGHSIGGAYALAFAQTYRSETKALILVDPRLPAFERACQTAGEKLCTAPPLLKALMPPAQRRETDGLSQHESGFADMSRLGRMPVMVFAATRPQAGLNKRWQGLWVATLAAETKAAANGKFAPVKSKHYIHRTNPKLVLGAIQAAVLAR